MNKIIRLAAFIFALGATLQAGQAMEKSKAPRDSSWNPISIYNMTGSDVAYVMRGMDVLNAIYGIKAGQSDLYHAKEGDTRMSFVVGKCLDPTMHTGDGCQESQSLQSCTRGVRYNADKINSILIRSLTECTITCVGGGSTSCIVR